MSRGAHRASAARAGAPPMRSFTLVDELSCYFDTPADPANVHLELRLPGRLGQRAFREAAQAALIANPRASGRRATTGLLAHTYRWEYPATFDVDPIAYTTFGDATELAAIRTEFIARSPSIDESPPIRLLVAAGPDCDHVILNAHHATMDGLSGLELLRDIGRRYRTLTGLSGGRTEHGALASGSGAANGHAAAGSVAEPPAPALRPSAWSRPARIAADGGGQHGCDMHLWLLPAVPGVPILGDGSTATLNDALITALIVTVGRWNSEHGRPRRQVRITVPVNVRLAGNRVAMGHHSRLVTISAMPPAAADLYPLLQDVAAQMRRARQQQGPQVNAGTSALAKLWCPAVVKRWVARAVMRTVGPLICDTVMLTNLGNVSDPPDFGQRGPVTLLLSGTAQMPRGLSIAVATAGRQPLVAMRFNRALLSDEAAARFLTGYIGVLGEVTLPPDRDSQLAVPLNPDWSAPAGAVTVSAD